MNFGDSMKKYMLGFLMLTYAGFVQAEQAEHFIAKYLSDFSKDSDLSGYFVEKPQFIFGPHTHTPESSAEASDFIRGIGSKLADSNYGSSAIEQTKILAKIDNYSLITFSLIRRKKDGTTLDKVCSTYGLLTTEHGYKILSWQPSEPDEKGQCG
jgi:hypothetical protein